MLLSHELVGAYALAAAFSIAAFWSLRMKKGTLELRSTGSRAHLAAELVTAVVLAAGGVGLLLDAPWSPLTTAVGLGMLGYAGLNIIGKYLGERNKAMVVVLFVQEFLTLVAVLALLSGH
jgi:hypothetical protein